MKAEKRLRARMRVVFNPMAPITVAERIRRANLFLRGWVNYFRVGNSARVFHKICWHVEGKLRWVLQRQAGRTGWGRKRYDSDYLYGTLGLYSDYRIRWQQT